MLIRKFHMENCKPTSTPLIQNPQFVKYDSAAKIEGLVYRSRIGSLLYLTAIRLDLMYSSSLLLRFTSSPSENYFAAAKRIFRYAKGTINYRVWYLQQKKCKLAGCTNSNFASNKEDTKSTSGSLFSLGSGPFSWCYKKQVVVA